MNVERILGIPGHSFLKAVHSHSLAVSITTQRSPMCLFPGRGSTGPAGPVSLHDGSVSGPDGGHGDRQALCLQPARCGPHPGPAELALSARHLRNPGLRHAGTHAHSFFLSLSAKRSSTVLILKVHTLPHTFLKQKVA